MGRHPGGLRGEAHGLAGDRRDRQGPGSWRAALRSRRRHHGHRLHAHRPAVLQRHHRTRRPPARCGGTAVRVTGDRLARTGLRAAALVSQGHRSDQVAVRLRPRGSDSRTPSPSGTHTPPTAVPPADSTGSRSRRSRSSPPRGARSRSPSRTNGTSHSWRSWRTTSSPRPGTGSSTSPRSRRAPRLPTGGWK